MNLVFKKALGGTVHVFVDYKSDGKIATKQLGTISPKTVETELGNVKAAEFVKHPALPDGIADLAPFAKRTASAVKDELSNRLYRALIQ